MTETFDPTLQKVLEGHFSSPPKPPAKVVRVFISSTFTDYSVERNAFIQRVYPAIKRYCRERYGTDFQIVDMRWGIRQDAQDDHRENDICLREIETAQRVSAGPNFILLLGQRYGTRSLNQVVPADEFEVFRDFWVHQQVDPDHLVLIDTWFKRDDNALPSVYVLQKISSILPNYINNDVDVSESDREEWRRIDTIIQGMLKQAAEECFRVGKLSEDRLKVYTVSVTEREIIHGILTASDVNRRVLVFDRTIDAIDLNHPKAWRFVDMIGKKVDEEAKQGIARVREQVFAAVDTKNIFQYRVPWSTKGGIDEVEHAQYIDDFCTKFYDECIRLIDDARRNERKNEVSLITEVVEHARHCCETVGVFIGREDLIDKVREVIVDPSRRVPFVIHGDSGSGKTTLTAKSAMECHSWLADPEHTRVILRFLGTTPTSSSILTTLYSICVQIISLYDLKHVHPLPDDMDQLQLYFSDLLRKVPSDHTLCIFLDSVDQLSMTHNAHELLWVPRKLPRNVKVVFSVLPGGVLDRFNKLFPPSAFLQVNPPSAETGIAILLAWFQKINRQLTLEQRQVIEQHLQDIECPPLNIKLIFYKIRTIASYESLTKSDLPVTVRESIEGTFQQLIAEHGVKLVSHALGYLTLSKNGISEIELKDLLSLDDEVLGDVYQFHMPSVRRLPSILWARIREDLEDYVVEREEDGVPVIYWYYHQFNEEATRMFIDADSTQKNKLCQSMVEYFLGTWSGRGKPFQYSEYWQKKMGIEHAQGEAERHVPDQRMETVVLDESGNKIIRYNRRKVSLILHLFETWKDSEKVLKLVVDDFFFNYEFMHAIFSTQRWEAIDIFNCVKLIPAEFRTNPDLKFSILTLFGTLLMTVAHANECSHNVAAQLCGRMLAHYGLAKHLTAFIDQCDELGPRHCALVSPHQQLPLFNGGEMFSIKKHTDPIQLAARSWDGYCIGSVSSQVLFLFHSKAGKSSVYSLPSCEQRFHRLYLFGNDGDLVVAIGSPNVFFIFVEDRGGIIFSHKAPKEEAICDLVAIGSLVAVSFEKRKEVQVYDFKEKKLIARLESPRDSGCVRKLVDPPLFYAGGPIAMFWLFWDNGDLTCHDPANLSAPAPLEPVGVPVQCVFWTGKRNTVIALLANGMLVSFWFDDSIRHRIHCLRQRLPEDCYELICTPNGDSVLLCCRNVVHLLKSVQNSSAKSYPMFHGACEETYDHAMIHKSENIFYLSRQGTVKSYRVELDEKQLRVEVIQVCEPHFRSIIAMVNDNSDQCLHTAAEDGIVKMIRVGRKPALNVEFDRTEASITKIMSQKTRAITIDETRSCVTVWDILHGKVTATLNVEDVHDATLSDDESTVAASTKTGSIALFRLTESSDSGPAQSVINHKTRSRLFYSSELRCVIAQSSEHVCLIADSDYHVDTVRIETDPDAASCCENGTLVALSADQQRIVLVSLMNRAVTQQIPLSSQEEIRSICLTKDSIFTLSVSQRLTTIGIANHVDITSIDEAVEGMSKVSTAIAWMKGRFIHIYSLPALTALQNIQLDTDKEYAHLSLTPDGHYLVYATLPTELHLRRVQDGALLGVYHMHTNIRMLATSADSHFVLTATEDRRLFVLLIVDPDIPGHLDRIKALPSRTPEMDETEKERRINSMEGGMDGWTGNNAASTGEPNEEEADFIEKQDCSQQPGWALNTQFIYGSHQHDQESQQDGDDDDSLLHIPTNDKHSQPEFERALAIAVTRSHACWIL